MIKTFLTCLALCFAPLPATAAEPKTDTHETMVIMQTADPDDNVTAPTLVADTINYDELDVGIREVVRWLNDLGFKTTDSGDGVSKPLDQRVFDGPHAIMVVDPASLVDQAHAVSIEASYDPASKTAVLMLFGLNDATFREARGREVERAKRDVNRAQRALVRHGATTKAEPS